jgi:hypothetical protein
MVTVVVSGSILGMVTIVRMPPVEISVKVNVVPLVPPAVVHVQRIVCMPMSVVIAVPGAKSPVDIAVSVVITEVIVAVTGTDPEMIKRPREIDDDARRIANVSAVSEITRCKQRPTILPAIVPIAGHIVTAVRGRHVVIRNPYPTRVTARPEARTPDISLALISPTAGHPEAILRQRLARGTFFQRFRWRR